MLLLCNWTGTALICSLARETEPRASSSLNEDIAWLPHGRLKSKPGPHWKPTSKARLSLFSSTERPRSHTRSFLQCGFTEQRCSSMQTEVDSPITPSAPLSAAHWHVNQTHSTTVDQIKDAATRSSFRSTHHVSLSLICPSNSHLSNLTIWCFSAVSLFCSFFFLPFLPLFVFIPLEQFTASTRACQLHTVVIASAPTT